MDGVFMRKLFARILVCLILAAVVWTAGLLSDRKTLNEKIIRMHVVANSDRAADQALKLKVRDAVIRSMEEDLAKIADTAAAKAYLQENLPKIRSAADAVLEKAGVEDRTVVSLCREAFDTRVYDTFSLPAGVYDALRITIGEGKGKNWWCVTFPNLCLPGSREEFRDQAAGAGFSDNLSDTLSGEDGYEVRFFILDLIGNWEKKLLEE